MARRSDTKAAQRGQHARSIRWGQRTIQHDFLSVRLFVALWLLVALRLLVALLALL